MKKNNANIETTKLGNKVQTDKKKQPVHKKTISEKELKERRAKRKETICFIFGMILFVVSIFLFISFTSFWTNRPAKC